MANKKKNNSASKAAKTPQSGRSTLEKGKAPAKPKSPQILLFREGTDPMARSKQENPS